MIFLSLFTSCKLTYTFKYHHRMHSKFSYLHYVRLSSLRCNLFECPREFWGRGSSTGMPFILGTRTFGNSTTKNGGPAIDVSQLSSMKDPTVHRWKVAFLYVLVLYSFICYYKVNHFPSVLMYYCGPGSSIGIATDYGLDGPGIEFRWRRDFPPV